MTSVNTKKYQGERRDHVRGLQPREAGASGRLPRGHALRRLRRVFVLSTNNHAIDGGTDADFLLCGGEGNDFVDGNGTDFAAEEDDCIEGGPGLDTLEGRAGNDTIIGAEDRDLISGGLGDDTITGDDGDDDVNGNEGNDTLNGGEGDDYISGEAGDDTLDGGNGTDTLSAGDGDDTCLNGETVYFCEHPP